MRLNKLTESQLNERLQKVCCVVFDVDGVLTDGSLYFTDEGQEFKAFNARDGLGIKMLLNWGIEVAVITGRHSASARSRLVDNLGIRHYHEGCVNKVQKLQEIAQQQAWALENIVYVGDDLIDIGVMQRVGVSMAVADAEVVTKQYADVVLSLPGGKGAAREVCEKVLVAKQQWQQVVKMFVEGQPFSN